MDSVPFTGLPDDVLIVEDDPIIALDFEDTIIGFGVKTVRTAASVAKALGMIAARPPDFALLDVGLISEKTFAVAERLDALGNSLRVRHRLWRRRQASASAGEQAAAAKALFERGAASGADAPARRRRVKTVAHATLGSKVVDQSATSARSRKVTVICPVAPSILT